MTEAEQKARVVAVMVAAYRETQRLTMREAMEEVYEAIKREAKVIVEEKDAI